MGIRSVRVGSLAVGLLLILALSVGVSAAGKVLLEDDFSQATNVWEIDSEDLGVMDGALTSAKPVFANAFAGEADWKDYSIEATVKIVDLPQYGSLRIFWRHNELWNGYGVSFAEKWAPVMRFDGNWDKHETLSESDMQLEVGKTYKVKIDVRGNTFTVYINGEKLHEAVDKENKFPTGRIGIRADYSQIWVDSVKVTSLD